MSAHFRAAALIREVRSLIGPAFRAARSLPFRLADREREVARTHAIARASVRADGRLFLESALDAAKSLQAPVISNVAC